MDLDLWVLTALLFSPSEFQSWPEIRSVFIEIGRKKHFWEVWFSRCELFKE